MYRSLPLVLLPLMLSGCPAPFQADDAGTDPAYDAAALDVGTFALLPSTGPGDGRPSCDPTAVIDLDRQGVRAGSVVSLQVDTRGRASDMPSRCTPTAGPAVVLRYRAPTNVVAVRVTTVAPGATFDTVLSARPECDPGQRELTCNDNDTDAPPQSTIWLTDLTPGDLAFLTVTGVQGARGVATVTLTEYPAEGQLDTPCRPIPPDRPLAARDPSRCTTTDAARLGCEPNAGPDGTDMCLRMVGPGADCDPRRHHNTCDPASECAQDPQPGGPPAHCALPGTAAGTSCRSDAPQCDPGFGCSTTAGTTSAGGCLREIPLNGDCDPSRMLNVCAPGSVCRVLDADAGLEHCVAM